jgi:membrane protease YdiL (CAAX protease family)
MTPSPERWLPRPTHSRLFDTPLFRFGEQRDRVTALVHTLVVLLVALVGASLLVVGATSLLEAAGYTEEGAPVVTAASSTAMQFVGFLVVGVTYLSWRNDDSLVTAYRPSRTELGWIVLGTIALAGAIEGVGALAQYLGYETAENVAVEQGREHPEYFLVLLPIQFLLTAPAEELLFRGVIQGLFRRAYGIVPGIVFASIVFGLLHYSALAGEEGAFVVITILSLSGVLLGVLYEYTGNLLVPVVVHAFWNALVFGTQYLRVV